MSEDYLIDHERRVKRAIALMVAFTLAAIFSTLLPLFGSLRPPNEALGSWWQRAGAPITVFAFLAQNKANLLGALLTPGTFTSAPFEALRRKYRLFHSYGFRISIFLTVLGTLVWGYGDVLINSLMAASMVIAK
ncbi:hypothetical protein M0D69_11215 [Caballeronia sp. SEWSISQ10-4 2]|uniref:hypothetical protein n=1 Tax=Caballeronia sp. SEWSISQ10-4 2 TaxID=2937438 RepID=UPI002654E2B0|nr:hypothetical protein [Caballeronia sp. SEWSISQ10-4 2]MDN7178581.1 hypothetical protein [Caballeronia sp. SEWSISQ10-4 2]